MIFSEKDRGTLIRTIWAEARGESFEGQMAVGLVIRNRARKPQWPNTIHEVCVQPWQFSCWNKGDPNLPKLRVLNIESADPAIASCRKAAEAVLKGEPDFTYGADHYYADYIATPDWARGEIPVKIIGTHRFFNLHPTPTKQDSPAMTEFYFLDFSLALDGDRHLEHGRLILRSIGPSGGRTREVWVSTTSLGTKQTPDGFHQRGGPIPPEYRVPSLKCWDVETKPINLKHVKGVEGNFYKILPFQVRTDKGGDRSDLGIHVDANVPGSMGCIVMTPQRFTSFEAEMKKLANAGIPKIPLFINYPTD